MLWSLLTHVLAMISAVACIPSWDGFIGARPQAAIGNLVPGASFIESLGSGISFERYKPKYLIADSPRGLAGPLSIKEDPSPPLFFINNQQLWQLNNQTSILRVNLMNVTDIPGHLAPLKLELYDDDNFGEGGGSRGIEYGVWRWRGTKLHFDLGKLGNNGVWFSCQTKGGKPGVYTSLIPVPAPNGCTFTTLHSFVNRIEKP